MSLCEPLQSRLWVPIQLAPFPVSMRKSVQKLFLCVLHQFEHFTGGTDYSSWKALVTVMVTPSSTVNCLNKEYE